MIVLMDFVSFLMDGLMDMTEKIKKKSGSGKILCQVPHSRRGDGVVHTFSASLVIPFPFVVKLKWELRRGFSLVYSCRIAIPTVSKL